MFLGDNVYLIRVEGWLSALMGGGVNLQARSLNIMEIEKDGKDSSNFGEWF